MKKILGLALGITMISLTPSVGNASDKIEMTCGEEHLSIEPTGGIYKVNKEDVQISFCDDYRMIMTMEEDVYDWWFISHWEKIKEGKTITQTDFRKNGEFKSGGKTSCTFKNLNLIKPVMLQNPADITGKFKLMNDKISCLKADVLKQENKIKRLKKKIR